MFHLIVTLWLNTHLLNKLWILLKKTKIVWMCVGGIIWMEYKLQKINK